MIIEVRVKLKQKFPRIEPSKIDNLFDDRKSFIAYLKSLPIDGEANREIITLLSHYFKVSKDKIVIKSGKKSALKLIEIKE